VQNPNVLLTILSSMAQKPDIKFDKLFQKLYNKQLWIMAYESIAANSGNMTAGSDGETIDGMSLELIDQMIEELKSSRYKPQPARRIYRDKANGSKRPIGIPSPQDKLLQTVVRFILEAIYEPKFSNASHGFRPERSCHTALEEVKKLISVRWWVEGDIKGFFDNLSHETLLEILKKRINDPRFLHLIEQFLKAGYIENWEFHKTYTGTPQGSNLSPILANIYLNELDQVMERKISEFNKGKARQKRPEYQRLQGRKKYARKKAEETGDWTQFHELQKEQLKMDATDNQDPNFRRMYYVRYADDFLIGIVGSKEDAQTTKTWLADYLRDELQLELSQEKTLITNAKERIRFLGYDIKRWTSNRILRFRTPYGVTTKRTTAYKLTLLIPRDKVEAFARTYGEPQQWQGKHRVKLLHLSELEILHIYNAEVRGFLNFYALADNFSSVANRLLWLTTTSFFKTLASKRQSSVMKAARSLKRGPSRYVIPAASADGTIKEHILISSAKYINRKAVRYERVDYLPYTWKYHSHSELGLRLMAQECEWCGTKDGPMEVHHVRKLKDLKGKQLWEQHMISRRRKTMILCRPCHRKLHAGTLNEQNKKKS
jgi:group II intron reverse transcriptase/maturase